MVNAWMATIRKVMAENPGMDFKTVLKEAKIIYRGSGTKSKKTRGKKTRGKKTRGKKTRGKKTRKSRK